MKRPRLAIANPREDKIAELAGETDHKTLAMWALDCSERVLPYFESKYPGDGRPRAAIEAGRAWVKTSMFSMAIIRKVALESHSAAREAEDDDVARSVARAAGQAVAAAHVPAHALAAAVYAATAVRDAAPAADADSVIARERDWQYQHLVKLSALKK